MAIQISGSTVIHDSQDVQVSGVVTATSFHGDASQLTNLPAAGSSLEATASGTLADGSTVIVNADGTVSVVSQTETTGAGTGSEIVFGANGVHSTAAVYDSTNNKIVIAYSDNNNSRRGTAVVGTVSGDNISFGSPSVFESGGQTSYISAVYDSSNEKVVISYVDIANSQKGTAVVGEVSGTSISFGGSVVFNNTDQSDLGGVDDLVYDSTNNKVVIGYRDYGNNYYGTAVVGTVSGTSISFGTPVVFNSSNIAQIVLTYDSTNNKVVIAYDDIGNSRAATAVVGTVSGTSISFGSESVYNSTEVSWQSITYDSTNGKVVIAFRDEDNSQHGKAIVGTVSGTSISFGSPVTFEAANVYNISATYDSTNDKVVIAYRDLDNSGYGTAAIGTVSGTSISFDTPIVFNTGTTEDISSMFNSSTGKVIITYQDGSNSQKGTALVLSTTGASIPSLGSPEVFESDTAYNTSSVFDSTNNKVIVAFYGPGTFTGKVVVGTVSGTSISFGSASTFATGVAAYMESMVYDSTNQKIVIAYGDSGNSYRGTAIVGTVSGTSVSFGSPAVFESTTSTPIAATFDSSNGKVVIAYRDHANSDYGTAVVGTVSGTSISFGTPAVFAYSNSYPAIPIFDSTNNKIVIAYRDVGNSFYGTAVVGTVSGTSISFGTPVVFESANSGYISAVFDSGNGKAVIAYRDSGNSSYGTAIVGTVSGTSISFGTPVVFESGNTQHISSTYDSTNGKVIIAYMDNDNNNYGTVIRGTVSGTSISFESPLVFNSNGNTAYNSVAYDSANDKAVISYGDNGNSNYGTSIVFSPITLGSNLTAENFIGISDGAYTNGQTATVQLIGSVDDAQSGLTPGQKYYVQGNGTLSTTAGSPSVLAGKAISSTKLAIKG